jgi:hypothetical protein
MLVILAYAVLIATWLISYAGDPPADPPTR